MTPVVPVLKRKRGRPKIAVDRRRSFAIIAYFTQNEAMVLDELSRSTRRSASDLVRYACRKLLLDRRGAKVSQPK